jgi:hypothetical protein
VQVDPIVDTATSDAMQAMLKAKNPKASGLLAEAVPARAPSFVRTWRAAPGEDENYIYVIALL